MGIPKFFRWLTRRYPLILQNVQKLEDVPPCDNLYLDLNGIVHNCIHGNDTKKHERTSNLDDFEEVWAAIMKAIDELVHTVKPGKVLLLAVDGVAPRAKMNQQRARRFRTAKDAAALKKQLQAQGKEGKDFFDSNAISPGTQFMFELCQQLHFFVKYKVNTDPIYSNLKTVVLTDGSVPGEGEHKMLDYIRQLRSSSDYDPNTRHCFYGADADLIMLSLLTHEPHFTIIREEHVFTKTKSGGVQRIDMSVSANFQLIYISLLREYLGLEYKKMASKMRFRYDLERIIDDMVFFCFFIGNDFLPALSALDIGEGALDRLISFYKTYLTQTTDYITDAGVIHWDRAEPFIKMLGVHEVETFRNRIDEINHRGRDRRQRDVVMTVTPEESMLLAQAANSAKQGQGAANANQNLVKFQAQDLLIQKKKAKVQKLQSKDESKKYKKMLLLKKFQEDDDEDEEEESKQQKQSESYQQFKQKFTELKNKQKADKKEESKEELAKDEQLTLHELIEQVDEGYLSELRADEIPDGYVSDFKDAEFEQLENGNIAATNILMDEHQNAADDAEQKNLQFMKEFVTLYASDQAAAKANYYDQKLGFDIKTNEGKECQRKMLKKYLEGLQWVLFYYYRGAQHWRWYYPYHYAPMIADLGENIVEEFLQGATTIEKFETDFNCAENSRPYTPFQQLLCILPVSSLKLLPAQYLNLAQGQLKEFFPGDFEIDLNGKTLPWEAIILIPFVDEVLFLDAESEMFKNGMPLNEKDSIRNKAAFDFYSYSFDQKEAKNLKESGRVPRKLTSPLRTFGGLDCDLSHVKIHQEYGNVGEQSFKPALLPGVQLPDPSLPSFAYLGVEEIEYDTKVVQRVSFERALVKIPSCMEEASPDKLRAFVKGLAKQSSKEMYINFPYQHEAFPVYFEDKYTMYTLYGDAYHNVYEIQERPQYRTPEEFQSLVNRIRYNFVEQGIYCPKESTNVLVTLSQLQSVEFDPQSWFYKTYKEKLDVIPVSLLMRRRAPQHYLNMQQRLMSETKDIQRNNDAICLNLHNFYGLVGKVKQIDARKNTIKIGIDIETQQQKLHDPFMGFRYIQSEQTHQKKSDKRKAFFSDKEIEQILKLKHGVINRLTGSFLIAYKSKAGERMVVDIGLNVKNYSKKLHIPTFVRFVSSGDDIAVNQHDDYNHNQFYKGGRNTRNHWEYSHDCVEIIKAYYSKYKEAFDCIQKCMQKNVAVHSMKDIYPADGIEDALVKIKTMLNWIEALPISKLPYVEMGFDTLNPATITGLNNHREYIKLNCKPIEITCKQNGEFLQPQELFQECFPFWSPPIPERSVQEYSVGSRVLNLNSSMREYIPFGLRGTVIGKTQDKVMVLFDEQFLGGSTIFGHCENYKGALVNPNYLLNITQKFTKALQKPNNSHVVSKYTEQPNSGENTQQKQTELLPHQQQAKPAPVDNQASSNMEPSVSVEFKPLFQPGNFGVKDLMALVDQTQPNEGAQEEQPTFMNVNSNEFKPLEGSQDTNQSTDAPTAAESETKQEENKD